MKALVEPVAVAVVVGAVHMGFGFVEEQLNQHQKYSEQEPPPDRWLQEIQSSQEHPPQ